MRKTITMLLAVAVLAIGCRDAAPTDTATHQKFGAIVEGQTAAGAIQALPLVATDDAGGVAVAVKATAAGTLPSGGATSANQVLQTTALNLLTQPRTTTAVTKSDSTDTSSYCTKGLWVGTAGDVEVIYCSDSYDASTAPVLKNIPSGTFVPGCFQRVMSTGTTATNVVCFGGTG